MPQGGQPNSHLFRKIMSDLALDGHTDFDISISSLDANIS
jgi:hypothetical protein